MSTPLQRILRQQALNGVNRIGDRGQRLIELVREDGRHLSSGAQAGGVEQLQLQLLQRTSVRSRSIICVRSLIVGLRQFCSPFDDTLLERFG